MSESSERRTNYGAILLTGFVSLLVGVGSGWTINFITEKRMSLEYELTSLEVFEGSQEQLGIVAVRITNTGKREIEQFHCQIVLPDAEIREVRHEGLPAETLDAKTQGNRLVVTSPFLNPEETFALQLLVEPVASTLASPEIEMRGKGVVGHPRAVSSLEGSRKPTLELLATALATMFTALAMAMTLRHRLRRTGAPFPGGRGEQRDDFAFLLELNGFAQQARELRLMADNQSYWALSDAFATTVLASTDVRDAAQRGVRVLKQLLELHSIAARSAAIIRLNMARLALAAGETSEAETIVSDELASGHKEAKARIQLIPEFREIAEIR